MKEFVNILKLIADGKIKEAESLLKEVGSEKEGEYWYAGAVLALYKGNRDVSLQFFLKSLEFEDLNVKTREYSIRNAGYLLFLKMELKKSIEMLEKIENKTVKDYFILFLAYTLIGDKNKSSEYFKRAYSMDKIGVKKLLIEFYKSYVEKNMEIDKEKKTEFVELINNIKNN